MCGVIGVSIKNVTDEQLEIIYRVLVESEIRGMHASGIAWAADNMLYSVRESKSMSELLDDESDLLKRLIVNDNDLNMIAHTRYSTSSLFFNQPIMGIDMAISHNGVISQSPAIHWGMEFSLETQTENDSELILRAIENGEDPFDKFEDASMAYVSLTKEGEVNYARNGKRPLWYYGFTNGFIVCSTEDILLRATNNKLKPMMVLPFGRGDELQ
jgi:glutamine phosphoribosylpyrophosphate amidotransferase